MANEGRPAGLTDAPAPGVDREGVTRDEQSPLRNLEERTLVLVDVADSAVQLRAPDTPPPTLRSSAEAPLPSGRFEEQGELARGGMGSIHKVLDRRIWRTVAVKRLHAAAKMVPGASARFLEEAQITGQLDHPNIVPVHDLELDDQGRPTSFSMKLVRGKTLRTLAEEAHAQGLSPAHLEAFVGALIKVCEAVAFAHSRGVIHRDIKPDNVMMGTHGQVYVMDWGIAFVQSATRSQAPRVDTLTLPDDPEERTSGERVLGTPAYMAPEQAAGDESAIDGRTDVFGIGGTLYRILTGRPPFAAPSGGRALELARAGVVPPPEKAAQGVRLPPGLCRIAERALAKSPDDRYPSVNELKHALEDFLRGGGWFRSLRFKAGTVIVREGDEPDAAYIIISGRVEAYKWRGSEKQSLRIMGAGEAFGETSIFAARARAASVVALDDVEVTEVTAETLERECRKNPWLRTLLAALAERFLDLDQQLTRLRSGD
ncbi:MAG: cyclic nucleotide-binding domain-containing protein [Polyangiaceae bacterium]|nr:cyclic nucleotide-binding domain-containing protein [Polyangiaceae bacterium]